MTAAAPAALRPLCLDQSLSCCGWARLDGQGEPQIGHWHLADGVANRPAGFVQLHRNLESAWRADPFNLLTFEAPVKTRVDKVDKLVALYGLVAHVESWGRARGVRVVSIDQRHWRETFLGKGYRKGRDREQVKRAAVERARQYGMDPVNTDQAEAFGMLDHILLSHKLQPAWRVAHPFLADI